jgi:sugar phosphate isomerase/epimerase
MMRLALVTTTPEVGVSPPVALLLGSFEERLEKAAKLGYDGVELMVARPSELDVPRLAKQLSDRGLEVAAIASGAVYMIDGLTLLAEEELRSRRARGRLLALIDLAGRLGAPLVTIGGFRGRLAWVAGDDGRQRLVRILADAAEEAGARGVRLVLEPLNRYESDIVNTAAEGLELIDQVGHSCLGLLLDTFHVNIEEASIDDCFRQAMKAGRLWHVHLGDSNRLPPGEGHLDFRGIVSTLTRGGYDGFLSAELLAKPDPDTAAEMTVRHMRGVLTQIGESGGRP